MQEVIRKPVPPFDMQGARQKVRMAENAWNLRDPKKISLAYTTDSAWRNRNLFINGRAEIITFLTNKFAKELDYRLCKELWCFTDDRIAVRFAYEWHDVNGQWYRSYGNENWEFDKNGYMKKRIAGINDLKIGMSDRKLIWDTGVRPDEYPSLSEMGL